MNQLITLLWPAIVFLIEEAPTIAFLTEEAPTIVFLTDEANHYISD